MFTLAIQTGLRISEIIGLTISDVHTGVGAHVHCFGKSRKERRTPLLSATVTILTGWITENSGPAEATLFTSSTGRQLSRDAIEHRIHHAIALAALSCPTLIGKRVSMHTLRHTAAMRLLHAGVDTTVIALWLGHEQIVTTNIYLKSRELHQMGDPNTLLRQLVGWTTTSNRLCSGAAGVSRPSAGPV